MYIFFGKFYFKKINKIIMIDSQKKKNLFEKVYFNLNDFHVIKVKSENPN